MLAKLMPFWIMKNELCRWLQTISGRRKVKKNGMCEIFNESHCFVTHRNESEFGSGSFYFIEE